MSLLPDRPDLDQLRRQAKELKRAAADGDQAAIDRILAHHPKFADRPPERLEGWHISLRDAQVTLAREFGFESWKALLAELEGEALQRWDPHWSESIQSRAFREAQKHGQRFCTGEHFLLALLSPPKPTPASSVLAELGLTYERMAERVKRMSRGRETKGGVGSTPSYQLIVGTAHGMALGLGSTEVTDEHVLMAIVYGEIGGDPHLTSFDIDSDDVVAALQAKGVATPNLAPAVPRMPIGPLGLWVYFPEEDSKSVYQEIIKFHPPGTAHWGTNRSKWKQGYLYVHGEDEIPMERIVKSAVVDPSTVEVLSNEEGLEHESATAPTLVEDPD